MDLLGLAGRERDSAQDGGPANVELMLVR